ncbi:MAG: N-acetylmuramoyl-L-alanine amidase [Clostridiales bacterium]|nr:N-acetylmuramoyl-L-alanine amidase [Clostridiales bacterium]
MQCNIYDWDSSKTISMPMEQLISLVASINIKETFKLETIKCFAIIARTQLARKLSTYGGIGCEKHKGHIICTEPGHCLELGLPKIEIGENIIKAVRETENLIITFDDKPIKPYYHYRCGGSTENSENVIGSRITYLRKVFCDFCQGVDDEEKDKFYTLEDLERLLNVKIEKPKNVYYNIRGIFENIDIDDQGRIKSLYIGGKAFKGTEIMEKLGLNSTRFNYMPVRFLISCIGTGHGLGLCITGAEEMAKRGMDYRDILNYYYTGIKIEEMELPEQDKPLKGKVIVLDPSSGEGDIYEGKGINNLREGEINLSIALETEKLLKQKGAKVYLTRQGKENVHLSDRAEIANRLHPDFVITIGQSTFQNQSASGTEAYYYREDKEAAKLGNIILEEICKRLESQNRGLRTADFYMLKEVKCSTLQLNLLYMTNPVDADKLANPDKIKEASEAITHAIIRHYSELGN